MLAAFLCLFEMHTRARLAVVLVCHHRALTENADFAAHPETGPIGRKVQINTKVLSEPVPTINKGLETKPSKMAYIY